MVFQRVLECSRIFIAEIHAEEDEGGAKEEPRCDLLVEQPPCEDDGGDGIEIHPVGGDDGTQFADHPVPCQETEHRCHHSEEQQVEERGKMEELKNGRGEYPVV